MSVGDLIVGMVVFVAATLLIGGFIGVAQIFLWSLHKTESTTTTMPDTRAYLEMVTDDGQRQWKRPAI